MLCLLRSKCQTPEQDAKGDAEIDADTFEYIHHDRDSASEPAANASFDQPTFVNGAQPLTSNVVSERPPGCDMEFEPHEVDARPSSFTGGRKHF